MRIPIKEIKSKILTNKNDIDKLIKFFYPQII